MKIKTGLLLACCLVPASVLSDELTLRVQHAGAASLANSTAEIVSIELKPELRNEGPLDHLQKRFREL